MEIDVKKILLLVLLVNGYICSTWGLEVLSPDGQTKLTFSLKKGVPMYNIIFHGDTILRDSPMGVELKGTSLSKKMELVSCRTNEVNENWKTVWGQRENVLNHYKEMTVSLINREKEEIDIIFRVSDKGVAFRYYLKGEGRKIVMDENTQFNFNDDNTAFWVPACFENDEYHYQKTKLSEVSYELFQIAAPKKVKYHPCQTGFNTPVSMKTPKGNYLCVHEAAIWDYPGFSLYLNTKTYETKTLLASTKKEKADISLPFATPWRVLILGQEAKDLLESDFILNLNDPCMLEDVSWIKPMKYVGIWWEMHVKKSDWAKAPGKVHGATTENAKRYIDFAAKYGLGGVLVEGWNYGWERNWKDFDYTTSYPDFDVQEVSAYAAQKGVQLIGHHETGGDVENYIHQMKNAYGYYQKYGVHSVKTGYVGKINNHFHYDQWMVNHYNSTVTTGQKYQLAINIHEPIKPSGICRTYPNLLSGEGMRGQEQNAWSEGNDVNHNLILPFTRNMAGPMDFTPGIFDVRYLNSVNRAFTLLKTEQERNSYDFKYRVRTTLCQQLALYVVFYSPIQMVADLLDNYEGHPAFQFIVDVPVDWKETKVLKAEIGEYVVTARQDRHSDNWYLGAITNDTPRSIDLSLSFLEEGATYEAIIYEDSPESNWISNPEEYRIRKMVVTSSDSLKLHLASGGGTAISFKKNKY